MFSLTREEIMRMSQVVISSELKFSKNVFAFTQEGVAMLSGVLRSDRAVHVNIAIMRAFVRLREAMAGSRDFSKRLDELERRIASHDENIQTLFQAIRQLMAAPEKEPKKNGFHFTRKASLVSGKVMAAGSLCAFGSGKSFLVMGGGSRLL
jgi:hypothetical protein